MGTDTAIATDNETLEPIALDPIDNGDGEEGPKENEIILSGEDGSQPQPQHGIQKRINKLNARNDAATEETSSVKEELRIVSEQNKLLHMALEQQTQNVSASTPPDPGDYDDGVKDRRYAEALDAYNEPRIAAAVQKQTSHLTPVQTENPNRGLELKQTKHYERADELDIKDFEEAEGKAVDILGNNIANTIISTSDSSHLILYHLGKNPRKAENLASLASTNPVACLREIIKLELNLSVKPRLQSEPLPDPDEELSGGSPSAAKSNKFQKKLDAAREAARDGGSGGMQAIANIKKEAQDAGVAVT